MKRLSRFKLGEKYGISKHTWIKYHDEVLSYLGEYMEIEEEITEKGRFFYIISDDAPESIPPFKVAQQAQKQKDYDNYVKEHLPEEFQYESKVNMSVKAIMDFSGDKYGHTSIEYVSKKYVSPAMEKSIEPLAV